MLVVVVVRASPNMAAPMFVFSFATMNCLTKSFRQINPKTCLRIYHQVVAHASTQPTAPVKGRKKPISKAMIHYLERAKAHEEMMLKESDEYKRGIRFLATMMGEDPAYFTRSDINKAIEYLLPSGLFEPRARPILRPPEEVFPKVKAAQFDETGRPFHYLFYTGHLHIYEIHHCIAREMNKLDDLLDAKRSKGADALPEDKFDPIGTEWLELKAIRLHIENFPEKLYEPTMDALDRLLEHPMSAHAKQFIMKYRKQTVSTVETMKIPEPVDSGDGRLFAKGQGTRKTSRANVAVVKPGKGEFHINDIPSLQYFTDLQAREQVLSPLLFTNLVGKVDVTCRVHGGGETGQSGAIRLAIAMALRSFVDEETVRSMILAGLLTKDPRSRERKKPGKEGARRGYTWLKR